MEDRYYKTRTNNVIAWIALVLAFLALIISLLAYNRSGRNLETQINEGINNTIQEIEDITEDTGQPIQDEVDITEDGIENGANNVDDGTQ